METTADTRRTEIKLSPNSEQIPYPIFSKKESEIIDLLSFITKIIFFYMKTIILPLPIEIHTKLKIKAATNKTTMKNILLLAIQEYLEHAKP